MAITDKGDNTGNVFIDALAAYSFLDIGGDRNITYTFATGGNISAHPWNALTEKAQWQNALQQWVNVANITAQEVSSSDADLREAWVDTGQMTVAHGLGPDGQPYPSYHDLPGSGGSPNGMYNRGLNGSFFPAAGVTTGGSGYWAFVQAIGQGLGLTPPFGTRDLANEPLFPGVTVSADLGDFGYNQMVYTTLSNNRGQYISIGNSFGYPVTPMAFDIAAIQFLYGPNTTFHSGSDGYGLPDENAPGATWQCIWDTGGTDTILYDGKKNATIDLRAATLVNGDPIAGGAISKVDGIFGGLTIANGVVIENAAGGSGNDTLIGNSADNVIDGKAGDDAVIYAGLRSAYTITDLGGARVRVTGPDGSDTISNVERLVFRDTTVTLTPSLPPPASPAASGGGWISTALGDFDNDGRGDFLWQTDGGSLAIWKMDGFQINAADYTRLGSSKVGLPGPDWHIAGAADFDGDGKADILWRTDSGPVAIWQMDGTHITTADYTRLGSTAVGAPGSDWHQLGAADFDGDHKADILWRTDSGALAIWEMDGTHIKTADYIRAGSTAVGAPGPDWKIVGLGDLDGDGNNDLLWETTGGALAVWMMNGTQIKSADYLRLGGAMTGAPGSDWHVADLGDFDGDGKADILWRTGPVTGANGAVPGGGLVAIWEMNGNQIKAADFTRTGSTAVGAPGPDWHLLGSDDYNGDGLADILWLTDSGSIAVWNMIGTHIVAADYTRIGTTKVGVPGPDWHMSEHPFELV